MNKVRVERNGTVVTTQNWKQFCPRTNIGFDTGLTIEDLLTIQRNALTSVVNSLNALESMVRSNASKEEMLVVIEKAKQEARELEDEVEILFVLSKGRLPDNEKDLAPEPIEKDTTDRM